MAWRPLLRQLTFLLGLGAVLGGLGTLAWLTQHPDSPALERATEWPVVGPLASSFREAYLGAPADEPRRAALVGSAEGPEEEVLALARPTASAPHAEDASTAMTAPSPSPRRATHTPYSWARDGAPATPPTVERPSRALAPIQRRGQLAIAPLPIPAIAWAWFLPGQPFLAGPSASAATQRALEALSYLPILRREGAFAEVLVDGRAGWLEERWTPPHDRRKARQGGLRQRAEPYRAADRTRLAKAKEILGLERPSGRLGPYDLWSDVEDQELLDFLSSLAAATEQAYFARYARLPSGDPLRAVVLFAREADYRAYSPETVALAGHTGHAGGGVLALFAEGRPRIDLARTFAHEITHLLDDRALALQLPTWLEEGLASDLGSVWVESAEVDGGGALGTDPTRNVGRALVLLGPDLRALRLASSLGRGTLPEIASVLALSGQDFYRPENAGLTYGWSAVFIRYLIDGDGARHREGFHRFLERIADGYDPLPGLLLQSLGIEDAEGLQRLELAFRRWLADEGELAKERIERRSGARVG